MYVHVYLHKDDTYDTACHSRGEPRHREVVELGLVQPAAHRHRATRLHGRRHPHASHLQRFGRIVVSENGIPLLLANPV